MSHNSPITKTKRKPISLDNKIQILDRLASGDGATSVGKHFGLHEATDESAVFFPNILGSLMEQPECRIEPGCNYTVKVSSTNDNLSSHTTIQLPQCIYHVCNCNHAHVYHAQIRLVNSISSGARAFINWVLVPVKGDKIGIEGVIDNNPYMLHISVQEGEHLISGPDVESEYSKNQSVAKAITINLTSYFSRERNVYSGVVVMKLRINKDSNYIFRSYVYDKMSCRGPETNFKLKFPPSLFCSVLSLMLSTLGVIFFMIVITGFVATVSIFLMKRATNTRIVQMKTNLLYNNDLLEIRNYNKWEISHDDIIIGREIGSGAFGRVLVGKTGRLKMFPGKWTVAIKQLKSNPLQNEIEQFLTEIETMKLVGAHQNIVKLLGCCTFKKPYLMIMEYVSGGDLLQYLRSLRRMYIKTFQQSYSPSFIPTSSFGQALRRKDMSTQFKHKEFQDYPIQIARGMKYLEEQQIIHRDLAARNILVSNRQTLKISDFGHSIAGVYVKMRNGQVPLRWLSIEALRDSLYSSKSDVWAFGVVLWEMGTLGGLPYAFLSNEELKTYLLCGFRLQQPRICSAYLHKLMLRCWHENPDERPTFSDILIELEVQNSEIYISLGCLDDNIVFPPTTRNIHSQENFN